MFLPVRIGRNSDSTEFTRPLSGSVRLINRHCPRTVTSATSNGSLSSVLSYIRPQIVLLQDDKSVFILWTVFDSCAHFLYNFVGFANNSDTDTSCLFCTVVFIS